MGRNKAWDRIPEKGKQKLFDSLPIPFPFVVAIALAIYFGFPVLIGYLFLIPNYYLEWVSWSVLIIFVLIIVSLTNRRYKEHYGKHMQEDDDLKAD